jgi:hypothetical protein
METESFCQTNAKLVSGFETSFRKHRRSDRGTFGTSSCERRRTASPVWRRLRRCPEHREKKNELQYTTLRSPFGIRCYLIAWISEFMAKKRNFTEDEKEHEPGCHAEHDQED